MKKSDLIPNEIYYHETSGDKLIESFVGILNNGHLYFDYSLNIEGYYNYLHQSEALPYLPHIIRLATKEEKEWFLACKKADNTFVPKSQNNEDEKIDIYYSNQYPKNQSIDSLKQTANNYVERTISEEHKKSLDISTLDLLKSYFLSGIKSNAAKKLHTKDMYSEEEVRMTLIYCVSQLATQFGHADTSDKMKIWNDATIEWLNKHKK